jgi:hypothetical protein
MRDQARRSGLDDAGEGIQARAGAQKAGDIEGCIVAWRSRGAEAAVRDLLADRPPYAIAT